LLEKLRREFADHHENDSYRSKEERRQEIEKNEHDYSNHQEGKSD